MNPKLQSQLQSQIKRLDSISSAPAILKPLVEMLRLPSDKIKVEDLIKLISYDVSISAQCLRLANSPLFGRRQTETVRSAVMALGLDKVRSLLLGVCLNHVIPPDKWVLDPGVFWRHSLGCALVTQRIAQIIDYPDTEKAYLAGLLHDLGFLANSVLYNSEFRECVRLASEQHVPLDSIEQQILGFTHADSGSMLCVQWGMPKDLVECARCHHDVSLLAAAGPLACLVHLGDQLCRVRYLGHGYEESVVFDLAGDEAWKVLGKSYPAIEAMDLVRFTLDIDGSMEQIVATVDAVFNNKSQAAPASG